MCSLIHAMIEVNPCYYKGPQQINKIFRSSGRNHVFGYVMHKSLPVWSALGWIFFIFIYMGKIGGNLNDRSLWKQLLGSVEAAETSVPEKSDRLSTIYTTKLRCWISDIDFIFKWTDVIPLLEQYVGSRWFITLCLPERGGLFYWYRWIKKKTEICQFVHN